MEHLRSLHDRRRERWLAGRGERAHHAHDLGSRIRGRLEVEMHVALLPGTGPIGDQPDAADRVTFGSTLPSDARTLSMRVTWPFVSLPWPQPLPDI